MPLNILSVIKLLGQSGSIATTVSSLIKEYKKFKENSVENEELRKAIGMQTEINEKLEKQIELLSASLQNVQKTLKMLLVVVGVAFALIIVSILLIFFMPD